MILIIIIIIKSNCTGTSDEIFEEQERSLKRRRTEKQPDEARTDDSDLPKDLFDQLRENEALCNLYRKHWKKIKDSVKKGKLRDTYNFRVITLDLEYLSQLVHDMFGKQKTAFKVNAGFGFILRNNETGELRYHYASSNTRILNAPFLIQNKLDLMSFIDQFLLQDPLEYARLQRPNSKWVVDLVTNMTLFVYKIPNHPIGGREVELPKYIRENRTIITLTSDPNNKGKPYNDNLCFFRCLALHQGYAYNRLEKKTKELYQQYAPNNDFKKFEGVKMSDLYGLEESFKTNIVVYELVEGDISLADTDDADMGNDDKDGDCDVNADTKHTHQLDSGTTHQNPSSGDNRPTIFARLLRRSLNRYESTMYLNLYGRHFSFISNIEKYTKSYICDKCRKLWKTGKQLNRHMSSCKGDGTQYRYPGGFYVTPQTIFDKFEEEGIVIPEELRYYPYRAVFDFEAFFDKTQKSSPTDTLTWEMKHVPVSASVCSNVPGYETPQCFISEGDPQTLVNSMMNYLLEISEKSSEILHELHAGVIEDISQQIKKLQPEMDEDDEGKSMRVHLEKLKAEFVAYLKELPVFGFNSGSYDTNLIKPYLLRFFKLHEDVKFQVKRNNNYMCIKTQRLRFMDIRNFLAPNFSYDAFLKAYDCQIKKGFFPYDWLDGLDKLDFPNLPPYEAFYSSLKNKYVCSPAEYAYCQQVWEQRKMQTMKDFLVWYNNCDVEPFVEAVGKMALFYRERKIDVFKDGISVPGLTMKYLFKTSPDAQFSLFDEKNKDLHSTFKSNLVGGPSIVFHRYHETGKTKIRGDKTCKKIVGYDANALYLSAIMEPMPTGDYTRRLEEKNFKKERKSTSRTAIEWLEWESYQRDIHIRHNGNNSEKRIGPRQLPVDGFCKETNQVFEFGGCYWHGHDCFLTKGRKFNVKNGKSMQDLYEKTLEKRRYIEELGYEYVGIWECEFYTKKRTDPAMKQFCQARRSPLDGFSVITPQKIIQSVVDGQLFGCIECDIRVPLHLRDYFSEMTPIFKNTNISRQDIGPEMQQFAEENNFLAKPTRSLIGSMFGEKVLLATPLLKWYISHGLEVTRIYQVIEYTPKSCFKSFGEAVSDARRAGDRDPNKAIIADTMKLIGNSSYGKTITNKALHTNIKSCNNTEASNYINEPLFRDLDEIGDDLYEVTMAKKTIKEDLPIQIGFFVYQYAKLRMLQFYYDFLDVFLDRSDFQYIEMDTDSAYIALAGESIEELVKPNLRERFEEEKRMWFPRHDTPENAAYDKRTPGLFKVEWEGEGIVALCSKTYYCFGTKSKFSCKGINKQNNEDIISKEMYVQVLTTKQSQSGVNKGFRVKDNGVYTYTQSRTGFTYFYPKRKVLSDGVSTTYLDI